MIDIKKLINELSNINDNSKKVLWKINIENPEDDEYDRYFDIVSIISNQIFKDQILLLTPVKFNDSLDEYWDLINQEKTNNNLFEEIWTLDNHTIKWYIYFLDKLLIEKWISEIEVYYNNSDLSNKSEYIKLKDFEVWNDGDESITLFFY